MFHCRLGVGRRQLQQFICATIEANTELLGGRKNTLTFVLLNCMPLTRRTLSSFSSHELWHPESLQKIRLSTFENVHLLCAVKSSGPYPVSSDMTVTMVHMQQPTPPHRSITRSMLKFNLL